MPQAIPVIIAGAKAIGAALAFKAGTVAAVAAWSSVLAVGTTLSTVLMARKIPKPESSGQPVNMTLDPYSGVPVGFGRTAYGGKVVYRRTYNKGFDNKYKHLAIVTALSAGGPIDSFESFHVNKYLATLNGDPTTGVRTVTSITPPDPKGKLFTKLRLLNRKGLTPDPVGITSATGEPLPNSPGKLSGVAHAVMLAEYDQEAFAQGPPNGLWVGKWCKVYDPRLDSTYPGGSGSQRSHNPATWAWSQNPYIIALTWAIGHFQNGAKVWGCGIPIDEIDVASFVTGANLAEANGWNLGGFVSTSDDHYAVLSTMLQAGGGMAVQRAGILSAVAHAPKTSIFTITAEDVIGKVKIRTSTPFRDRINRIAPKYRAESQYWDMVDGEYVTSPVYLTEDSGMQKTETVSFPLVQNAAQAHQLATYEMVNSREMLDLELSCKPRLLDVRVGECVTVTLSDLALSNQKFLVISREYDPLSFEVRLKLRSETDAKHPFALGQTQVAPPTPALAGFDALNPSAPGSDAWAITDTAITDNGVSVPALVINGEADDPYATHVIAEYRPLGSSFWIVWAEAPVIPGEGMTFEITALTQGTAYECAISYRTTRNVISPRLELGPQNAGASVAGGVRDGGIDWNVNDDGFLFSNAIVHNGAALMSDVIAGVQAEVEAINDEIANVASDISTAHLAAQNSANAAANAAAWAAANATAALNNATASATRNAWALTNATASQISATQASANAAWASANAIIAAGQAGFATTNATAAQQASVWAAANATAAELQKGFASTNAVAAATQLGYAVSNASSAAVQQGYALANATSAQQRSAWADANAVIASVMAGFATSNAATANTARTNAVQSSTWAGSNATIAQSQATYASTNATAAQQSAGLAATFAGYANTNASISSTQAGYATSNASVAQQQSSLSTTYAGYANSNAALANTQRGYAASNATIASTQAGYAGANASAAQSSSQLAATYSGYAGTNATSAQTQAGIATTQAGFATSNAASAQASAGLSATFAGYASTNATISSTQAGYAGSNASLAQTSAQTAASFAGHAQTNAAISATQAAYATSNAAVAQTSSGLAATWADNARHADTAYVSEFANALDGWTGNADLTATAGADHVAITYTGNNGQFSRSGLSFAGSRFPRVVVDVERTGNRTTGAWLGRLTWATSGGHGYDGSLYAELVSDTLALNERTTLTFDMTTASVGGTDWVDSTITALRLSLESGAGASYRVYSVRVVGPDSAAIAKAANAATSNATIASTQAGYAGANAASAQASAGLAATFSGYANTNATISSTQAGYATTNASAAQSSSQLAATYSGYAGTNATAAQTSAGVASTQAGYAGANASSAQTQSGLAATYAGYANSNATAANTQRGYAVTNATLASTQAGYATSNASAAQSSSQLAATYSGYAGSNATAAQTQAGIATTQAGYATSNASLAQTQSSLSATYAGYANSNATAANTQRGYAASNATIASTQAGYAGANASAAQTQSGLAATYAGYAQDNASTAQAQAGIATTQAGYASANAANAQTSSTLSATFADNSRFVDTHYVSAFNNSLDGWSVNANLQAFTAFDHIVVQATGANGLLTKGSMSFSGAQFTRVIVDIERAVNRTSGAWVGRLTYTTSGHGYDGTAYAKDVADTLTVGGRSLLTFDMDNLTVGGFDWVSNTITGLRFSLDGLGSAYRIYSIRVVGPDAAAISKSALAAQTNATISTTQAGYATSNAASAQSSSQLAATYSGYAGSNATAAQTQAGIATTQAGYATSNASAAQTQSSLAATYSGYANSNAALANTQRGYATTNATIASTQAGYATSNASTALTQSGLATSYAGYALNNATVSSTQAGYASSNASAAQSASQLAATYSGYAQTNASTSQVQSGYATANAALAQSQSGLAAEWADNARHADTHYISAFNNSLDGWSPSANMQANTAADHILLTAIGSNGFITKGSVTDFAGSRFNRVVVDIERTANRTTGAWVGRFIYSTAGGHGYDGALYSKEVPDTLSLGERSTLTFDMSALTVGGADWVTSTISGIRLLLETGLGSAYKVYSVRVVGPDNAAISKAADAATSNATIASTQAGYATSNAAAALTQSGLSATYAGYALSNATAADTQADYAAANATAANTQRGYAVTNATLASTQAGYATSNASLAQSSSQLAATYSGYAGTNATTAQTQAGIATTQAGYATSNAATAQTQSGLSATYAGYANSNATAANTQRGYAAANATIASTQAGYATSNASTAQTQSGLSATFAGYALANATAADTQRGYAAANASLTNTQLGYATANAALAETKSGLAATWADNARFADTAYVSAFSNALDGWSGSADLTATAGVDHVAITYSGNNGQFTKGGLSFAGSRFPRVVIDIERTTNRTAGAWVGRLTYSTAGHSYDGALYAKLVPDTLGLGERSALTFDMSALSVGGTDWTTSTITGLRFQFESAASAAYKVYSVRVIGPDSAAISKAAEAATSNASIATTQAGYATSNAATALTQSGLSATYAGYALSNATAADTQRSYAAANATLTNTQLGYATSNAATAQTQSGLATTFAGYANANAATANTQRGYAAANATLSQTQSGYATANASLAQASAGLAATFSGYAQTNATIASTQAGYATSNASAAQSSTNLIASYAATARTQTAAMLPETFSSTDYWTETAAGSPETVTSIASSRMIANATVGNVYQRTGVTGYVVYQRGVVPTDTGKTYEVTAQVALTSPGTGAQTPQFRIFGRGLGADYVSNGSANNAYLQMAANGVFTATRRFAATSGTNTTAFDVDSVWSRFGVQVQQNADALIELQRLTVADVTQVVLSEAQTGFAASNASIATTQAGYASANASSAQSSSSLAASHSGYAQTNATVAQTQAGYATANASTAQTQAGLAATHSGYAQTNASVASTQAGYATSNASTATTQAGLSATYSGYANSNAVTAQTQASIATTQAGYASANAVTAQSERTLAATFSSYATANAATAAAVSTSALNKNPAFADWTGTYPASFTPETGASGTTVTKVAGLVSANAMRITSAASTTVLVYQNGTSQLAAHLSGYYVMECDFTLVSGVVTGFGLLHRALNGSTALEDNTMGLHNTPDINGVNVGAGTVGRTYRVRKLYRLNQATMNDAIFYVGRWSGFGAITSAGTIDIHRAIVRPASAAESELAIARVANATLSARFTSLEGAAATANAAVSTRVDTVSASVGTISGYVQSNATAIATLQGRVQATAGLTVSSGNKIAGMKLLATDGNPASDQNFSTIEFSADVFKIFNPGTGTGAIVPFTVANGVVNMNNAYIANLATGNLIGSAITDVVYTSTDVLVGGVSGDGAELLAGTISLDVTGTNVLINFAVTCAFPSSRQTLVLALQRNGTVIHRQKASFDGQDYVSVPITYMDTPGNGTFTYRVVRESGVVAHLDRSLNLTAIKR
jgi:hypothetical protein